MRNETYSAMSETSKLVNQHWRYLALDKEKVMDTSSTGVSWVDQGDDVS
jgi:hypothetical protein